MDDGESIKNLLKGLKGPVEEYNKLQANRQDTGFNIFYLISDYYYRTVFVGIDGIRANAAPVIVSSTGNTLTVQGAEDGESVTAYGLDGRQLGSSVCRNGQAILRLSTRTENVILVKIGDDTIKVRVK